MIQFLILSLALRLQGFLTPALWFDEAVSKYRASLPYALLVNDKFEYSGVNVWELVLRPFAIGPAWLLRLPSMFFGMVSLYLAWRLMEKWQFSRAQKITSAIGLALLPGLIWQAQDARFYAALSACFLGALWYAVNDRPVGLAACAGLAAFIHPVGAAYGCAAFVLALLYRMPGKHLVLAGSIAAVSWMVRYKSILLGAKTSTSFGANFWLNATSPIYVLEQSIQALFVNTLSGWIMLLVVFGFITITIIYVLKIRSRNQAALLIALFTPAIIIILVSVYFTPVYFYRPIQPLAFLVCLLVGWTVAPAPRWYKYGGAALVGIVLLISFASYNPAVRGGNIDQIAGKIGNYWNAGDKIVYVTPMTAMPFIEYIPDLDHCLLDMPIGNKAGQTTYPGQAMCAPSILNGPGRIWLVWLRDPIIDAGLHAYLADVTAGMVPIATTTSWQVAPIEIYLLNE